MTASIVCGDALHLYDGWPAPVLIISDGPYGVGGYDGDLRDPGGLAAWYKPHIEAWAKYATAQTTLWFWNTEIGWAEVHPVLRDAGWQYRAASIWDKGIAHIAGNCNTRTLRKFPIVTEICVHYVRKAEFRVGADSPAFSAQDWLRAEWQRTGLAFNRANEACGVKNAATRKYLAADHVWYFPPPDVFDRLAAYANSQGDPSGRPYFSLDGRNILSGSKWQCLRGKFHCPAGITNVWNVPAVRGQERIKHNGSAAHPNQKPLELMRLLVGCSTDPGDVVWEPFGGLCTGSLAATELGRPAYAAEINPTTHERAIQRFGNR